MTARPKCPRLLSFAAALLLTMSGSAFGGDDDKAPAYMIYIDPVTGKYTTTKPHNAGTADAAEQPVQAADTLAMSELQPAAGAQTTADVRPVPNVERSNAPLFIAGASVLVALLVLGVLRNQRNQLHSE